MVVPCMVVPYMVVPHIYIFASLIITIIVPVITFVLMVTTYLYVMLYPFYYEPTIFVSNFVYPFIEFFFFQSNPFVPAPGPCRHSLGGIGGILQQKHQNQSETPILSLRGRDLEHLPYHIGGPPLDIIPIPLH